MKSFKEFLNESKKVKIASKVYVELTEHARTKNKHFTIKATVWKDDEGMFVIHQRARCPVSKSSYGDESIEYTGIFPGKSFV